MRKMIVCSIVASIAGLGVLCAASAQDATAVDITSREFIKSWLICGPFPNPLAPGVTEYRHDDTTLGLSTDFLQPVGGEVGVQPQEGLSVAGPDGTARVWQAYVSPEDQVNLCKVYSDNQNGKVAYAACRLISDADREIVLGLGSNDGVRVWVNGALIWDNPCSRGADIDQDLVVIPVKQGVNTLLLKIDQGWGNWGFYARIVDREQKITELTNAANPELAAAYKAADGKLTVWMGRTSQYRIFPTMPVFRAVLRNADGDSVASVSSIISEGAVIDTAALAPGAYWIKTAADLPGRQKVVKELFYFHGNSPITVKTYDAQGLPCALKIEMLRDKRQLVTENSSQYDALGDRPELVPVKDGIIEQQPGLYSVVHTEISPFWLRVLLEVPGLGRQWFMTNAQGYAINAGEIKEIDALADAERALRTRFTEVIEAATPMPEWLYQSIMGRLSAVPLRRDGRTPGDTFKSLFVMSSMKSLLVANDSLSAWYAPSIEKVGKHEAAPSIKMEFAPVSLARNEYEAFQVVLTPAKDLNGVTFTVDTPKTKDGQTLASENISLNLVDYVKVETPTDYFGTTGLWPDPLPPITGPQTFKGGENYPLWITVYAPQSQLPGTYSGKITVQSADCGPMEVPFSVTIQNFALSPDTHTDTAYGVSPNYAWHGPLTAEQQDQVFDLYMKICASHRISPYTPHERAPIDIRFEGTPAQPVVDFLKFDAAMTKYLNEYRFTSFNLGAFPTELNGFARYTTEYNQAFYTIYSQIQEHLRKKGWLKKAYWYWVDEPPPSQYADVKKGMDLIQAVCPDIRRLLTCNQEDAPVPFFFNSVNLWVPILDRYDPLRAAARQDRGETMWWYVCTGPKAPYANNFIDHPAINHRIRYWQMGKYGVDGCLYWSANYWAQNPWEQAMSLNENGGPWGNGDGRLLYPPRRTQPTEAVVEPPVSSIRFENIRDGLEDREEFIVLERAVARRGTAGLQIRRLLTGAYDTLSPSLTCYEQNPLVFYVMKHQIDMMVGSVSGG